MRRSSPPACTSLTSHYIEDWVQKRYYQTAAFWASIYLPEPQPPHPFSPQWVIWPLCTFLANQPKATVTGLAIISFWRSLSGAKALAHPSSLSFSRLSVVCSTLNQTPERWLAQPPQGTISQDCSQHSPREMSTLPANASTVVPSSLSSAAALLQEGAVPCLPATFARGSRAWPSARVPAGSLPAPLSHPLSGYTHCSSGLAGSAGWGGWSKPVLRTSAGWPRAGGGVGSAPGNEWRLLSPGKRQVSPFPRDSWGPA